VSLDLARKLQEAGYPQEDCNMYWLKPETFKEPELRLNNLIPVMWEEYVFAAPCGCSILEQLPGSIMVDGVAYFLEISKTGSVWEVGYVRGQVFEVNMVDDSLSETAGLMYVWLKTEGYL